MLKNEDYVLKCAFDFLLKVVSHFPNNVYTIYNTGKIDDMLRIGLIDLESEEIRKVITTGISSIC